MFMITGAAVVASTANPVGQQSPGFHSKPYGGILLGISKCNLLLGSPSKVHSLMSLA